MEPSRQDDSKRTPSMPRVYNFLTGGHDNYVPDQELAEKLQAESPEVRDLARVSRRFVLAATTRAVSLGIRQVLDLGAGLPLDPSVYATARASGYPVTVAYVDKDPDVVNRLTSAVYRETDVAVVKADITDPARVLADPGVLGVIDLDEPVLILLGATLSSMGAQAARGTVAGYSDAVVPGSRFAISCASWRDPAAGARIEALFGPAGEWHNHSRADIESFFAAGGLTPAAGFGIVMDLTYWPAAAVPEDGAQCRDAGILGGVGVRI